METYEDGTIIQIGSRRFALAPWDDDQQLADNEVVYAGYTRADWSQAADATWIVKELDSGEWLYCDAGGYNPQFHDDGGLRIVGAWRSGRFAHVSDRGPWDVS